MGRLTRCGIMLACALALLVCGQAAKLGPLGAATAEAATISVPDPLVARSIRKFKVLIDVSPNSASDMDVGSVQLRAVGSGQGWTDDQGTGNIVGGKFVAKFLNSFLVQVLTYSPGGPYQSIDDQLIEVKGTLLGGTVNFTAQDTVDIFKPLTISSVFIGDALPDMAYICDHPDYVDNLCPSGNCPLEIGGRRYCDDDQYHVGEPVLVYCFFDVDEATPQNRLRVKLFVEFDEDLGAYTAKQKSSWLPVSPGPGMVSFIALVPYDAPTGAYDLKVTLKLKKGRKVYDTATETIPVTVLAGPADFQI